ncbi:MAG: glycosyl hydrolase [Mucilaginibacter sp.]
MLVFKNRLIKIAAGIILGCLFFNAAPVPEIDTIRSGFINPPASARPGVYWYFMDGNISREGITKDLQSMKRAGIGSAVFLEVNVGVPRGKVDFLSDEWQQLFAYAMKEAERLGISITLGIGPGWTGSGGPWVKPEQSMQHLVSVAVEAIGGQQNIKLPVPAPKKPYFDGAFTPKLQKIWQDYYADVAVLAFPTPAPSKKIDDIDEKALYYRPPYSSTPNVKPFIKPGTNDTVSGGAVAQGAIINITNYMQPDGTLTWKIPAGHWTIMRFVSRNNGAATRPAPLAGVGFEADKFDTTAVKAHLNFFTDKLVKHSNGKQAGGLKTLHMDSWEMGAQNWSPNFRQEFIKRRGYDPLPYYPVYSGVVVGSTEISERFLWDLRQTSQELVIENYAGYVKKYSHRHGFKLSVEPYDMNPAADLELGAVGDIPMGEFWSKNYGFNTAFSCIEASSIAHVNGQPVVNAEAFTAQDNEGWRQHPASMKAQGDWAFATGINNFMYHTFQHQFLNDNLRPGMTMGPYGVHWDRNQTWWPWVSAYHQYIARCQYVLRQGRTVADILYLIPEGAPHVFSPPADAVQGDKHMPDRKGYNFDACAPSQLLKASVKDHRIIFPGGASFSVLILPDFETMTPKLLAKIMSLVKDGAYVIGRPPVSSPGLSGYPASDKEIQDMAAELWGGKILPATNTTRNYGAGKIIWGGEYTVSTPGEIYVAYKATANFLKTISLTEDFTSTGPIRYTHRTAAGWDIYFVANTSGSPAKTNCAFRPIQGTPELWDPLTGQTRPLPQYTVNNTGTITIPVTFQPSQSFFVVFTGNSKFVSNRANFTPSRVIATLNKPWQVSFDSKWGGPASVKFDKLTDWSVSKIPGIKYYSGMASYQQTFDIKVPIKRSHRLYLNLGEVCNMAKVTLNGKNLGVVWTSPWRVDITNTVKANNNQLTIEVANLWPNRLIGDEQLPDDGITNGQWPAWLVNGTARSIGRYTFTTYNHYNKNSPLLKSGLLGPVTIQSE